MMPTTTMANQVSHSNGATLVTPRGVLALVGTAIDAQARGGLCRLVLRQRFSNPHAEPLHVTYSLPVPEDAAVSGFSFTIGDRRIVGEIDRKASARRRFEDAILAGRTAALLDEERSTLFSQEIGNIPPGADLDVEIEIDQHLRWLEEGQWELRIPSTIAPRYLGAEGRVPDARAIHQQVSEGSTGIALSLCLSVQDALIGKGVCSPSHEIIASAAGGGARVGFTTETVALDRDVVVRWQVSRPEVGAQLTMGDASCVPGRSFGLLTLVPPEPSVGSATVARDLVLLLDTSGSMSGEPLEQAKRVASTLVSSLTKHDTLEMVQFSWSPRRWQSKPVRMNRQGRRDALSWLGKLKASGGTEMREGILAALEGVTPGSQRQVVLVTDGLIGFEQEIVATILRELPAGSRVHTVGVGSAVNRTLTAGASRAGKGIEVILGLGEDPEPAALRLDARTRAPVVVDLEVEGPALLGHAPSRLPDLFKGAPVRIAVELAPAGGTLLIKGRTAQGEWTEQLTVPSASSGSKAIAKLFGRELVNDLEMNLAAGESGNWDAEIERTGLVFQVATRMTSWVAIDAKVSVDPDAPTRRQNVPQQLPHGMSVEGLGLRAAQPMALQASVGMLPEKGRARRAKKKAHLGRVVPGAPMPPPPRSAAPAGMAPPQAPPAPSPAAPKAQSAVRRAADAVRGFFGKREEPSEQEAQSVFEGQSELIGQIVRILSASIVRFDGGRLIAEATVTHEPLTWEKPNTVELVWADGSRVQVDVKQGTRSGWLEVGIQLRLVLDLSGQRLPPGRPVAIHVTTGEGVLAIELS